jgi:hypothetical protein
MLYKNCSQGDKNRCLGLLVFPDSSFKIYHMFTYELTNLL